ncbi:lipoprotein [Amylibacter sp. SFDW26]|nr:lipoprotein [Amylibacter sp. SFDW26]
MAVRLLVVMALSLGVVACGVKGDPLPRTETSEE